MQITLFLFDRYLLIGAICGLIIGAITARDMHIFEGAAFSVFFIAVWSVLVAVAVMFSWPLSVPLICVSAVWRRIRRYLRVREIRKIQNSSASRNKLVQTYHFDD